MIVEIVLPNLTDTSAGSPRAWKTPATFSAIRSARFVKYSRSRGSKRGLSRNSTGNSTRTSKLSPSLKERAPLTRSTEIGFSFTTKRTFMSPLLLVRQPSDDRRRDEETARQLAPSEFARYFPSFRQSLVLCADTISTQAFRSRFAAPRSSETVSPVPRHRPQHLHRAATRCCSCDEHGRRHRKKR